MPTFDQTRAGYAAMWARAQILPGRLAEVEHAAAGHIIANRGTYAAVELATGVPWYFIGCLHNRESNCNFQTHLHNGDSLANYTHQVPPGRPKVGHGPPFTWIESAIDALKMHGLDQITDWSIERMLYEAERFNGWGYIKYNENSPYDWAATTLQQRGKFTSDGHYDAGATDSQLGVAAILKELASLDPEIAAHIAKSAPIPPKEIKPVTTTAPAIADPIPQIIATLETVAKFAPMLAGFLPPPLGPMISVAIPILEELLQLAEDAKTKGGTDLIQAIGTHLQAIGQHVQTVAATAATPAAPPAIAQQAGGQ